MLQTSEISSRAAKPAGEGLNGSGGGRVRQDLLLDVPEAASLLGLTPGCLYWRIKSGKINGSTAGRRRKRGKDLVGLSVAQIEALVGPLAPADIVRAKKAGDEHRAAETARRTGRSKANWHGAHAVAGSKEAKARSRVMLAAKAKKAKSKAQKPGLLRRLWLALSA